MPESPRFHHLKERKLVQWALAYLAGAFVVFQAVEVMAEPWGFSPGLQRAVHILLILGLFITLVLAWYHGERGRRRIRGLELLILAGILVIAGAAVAYFGRASGGEEESPATPVAPSKSVAVLPFANLSADPDNEYFSDGVTVDIINHLAKLDDLTVSSRTSVMRYKASDKSLRQIGEELGVSTIVEGEVQRIGDRVRTNAQLIDVGTDAHLWADQYDRQLADVFAIQSDIAERIAQALKAELSLGERERLAESSTDNLEAYDIIVAMEDMHKYGVLNSCPDCEEKIIVWNIEDPYFMPDGNAEKIFNRIRQKVEELADSL